MKYIWTCLKCFYFDVRVDREVTGVKKSLIAYFKRIVVQDAVHRE
jgi:hypothetical protein